MYKKWYHLISLYTSDNELIRDSFDKLNSYYSASGRYYHNLQHIQKMLLFLEKHRKLVSNYQLLQFAIWFHDAIYQPQKLNNELKSAQFMKTVLGKTKLTENKLNRIYELILFTKNHEKHKLENDFDAAFFLDLDLVVLSLQQSEYQIYMNNIRKEYAFVPNLIYRIRRKNILKRFLKLEHIFRTPLFRQKFEKQARENIKFEISSL